MDRLPLPIMDTPATYRIVVFGQPDIGWIEAMLGDAAIESEHTGTKTRTTITVKLIDQASLLGLINALYNLGHAVLSIEQITSDDQSEPEDKSPQGDPDAG